MMMFHGDCPDYQENLGQNVEHKYIQDVRKADDNKYYIFQKEQLTDHSYQNFHEFDDYDTGYACYLFYLHRLQDCGFNNSFDELCFADGKSLKENWK